MKYYLSRNNYLNNDMDIIDLHDPSRVNRSPDDVKILLDNGNFVEQCYISTTENKNKSLLFFSRFLFFDANVSSNPIS